MAQGLKVERLSEKSKDQYNQFVASHNLGSIHQLWEWGEFQSKNSQRDQFWVVAIFDQNHKIVAATLVIKQKLPKGKCWLYCPRGPLADFENQMTFSILLEEIKRIAKEQNAIFLRIDPGIPFESPVNFKQFGFKKAHAHYQPEHTLLLDLHHSEAEILAQMKPKGRYNIKVAQKHGVIVRESDGNKKDLENFYQLLQTTTERDGFAGHPLAYYQNMLEILGEKYVKLYIAEYKGEIIAGIIVTFFKDTAIYYFGVSGNKDRQVMAPYLLQWKAISEAKSMGMKFYDFLGIAPEHESGHAWAGVTNFKLKFGGKRLNYQPAQELVYQPFWYWMMRFMKKLLIWKLKFFRKR